MAPNRHNSHHRLHHHSSQSCLSTTTRSPLPQLCHNTCHNGSGNNTTPYATLDHRLLRQPLPPPPQFTTNPSGTGKDPFHAPSCGIINPKTSSTTDGDEGCHSWSGVSHVWVDTPNSPTVSQPGQLSAMSNARALPSRMGIACVSSRENCDGRQLLLSDQHESSV